MNMINMSQSEIINESGNRELKNRLVTTIYNQAWLLLNYLNDIFDITSIKMGDFKKEVTCFNLQKVIEHTID